MPWSARSPGLGRNHAERWRRVGIAAMVKDAKWSGEPEGLWTYRTPAIRQENRPSSARLAALMSEETFMFPYPRGERIKREVRDLMMRGRRAPFSGVMIASPRSNGRSTLARQIVEDLGRDAWLFTMPPTAAYGDLWLTLLGDAVRFNPGSFAREVEALEVLKGKAGAGLKLVVIDDCDSLLDVPPGRRRVILHCIAKAWDVSGVPFLLIGTPILASRILSDRSASGSMTSSCCPPGG